MASFSAVQPSSAPPTIPGAAWVGKLLLSATTVVIRGSLAARNACGQPHDCPMVATFDVSTLPYSALSLRLFSAMAQSRPLIRTAGSLMMSGFPFASFSFATAAMLPRITRKGISLRPIAMTRYPCDASSPRNRVNSTDVFLHPPLAHSKTGSLGVFERSAGL